MKVRGVSLVNWGLADQVVNLWMEEANPNCIPNIAWYTLQVELCYIHLTPRPKESSEDTQITLQADILLHLEG